LPVERRSRGDGTSTRRSSTATAPPFFRVGLDVALNGLTIAALCLLTEEGGHFIESPTKEIQLFAWQQGR